VMKMARKRGSGSEEEGANWMDTYGDMVTLILTFFVLLYSMSSIDQQKWQYVAQAFASMGNVINTVVAGEVKVENPSGNLVEEAQLNAGEVPENFDQLYQYIAEYVDKSGLSESIEVEKGAASVYLKFRDNVFFSPDSAVLRYEGKNILNAISPGIKAVDKYILGIKINGYTAEAQFSTKDEWELSSGRSNAVLKYLMGLNVCPTSKFSSSGFGKYRPVDTNETEDGRRQNRRVEIIIARNDADYSDPKVLEEFFRMEFGDGFVVEAQDDAAPPSETTAEQTAAPAETTSAQETTSTGTGN